MKTGAQIVADIEKYTGTSNGFGSELRKNWPDIRAALLAYEPKSALRTILERCHLGPQAFSADELEAARVELSELEREREK